MDRVGGTSSVLAFVAFGGGHDALGDQPVPMPPTRLDLLTGASWHLPCRRKSYKYQVGLAAGGNISRPQKVPDMKVAWLTIFLIPASTFAAYAADAPAPVPHAIWGQSRIDSGALAESGTSRFEPAHLFRADDVPLGGLDPEIHKHRLEFQDPRGVDAGPQIRRD